TNAKLGFARGIAFDPDGNLYIADPGNNCVRKVDKSTGKISTVAGIGGGTGPSGGDGLPATLAQLNSPANIAFDGSDLYIGEEAGGPVRKVSGGIITTFAGGGVIPPNESGPATLANLKGASGIGADKLGALYINDSSNRLLRKVDPSGTIETVARPPNVGNV